jgi:hypothetical protein
VACSMRRDWQSSIYGKRNDLAQHVRSFIPLSLFTAPRCPILQAYREMIRLSSELSSWFSER